MNDSVNLEVTCRTPRAARATFYTEVLAASNVIAIKLLQLLAFDNTSLSHRRRMTIIDYCNGATPAARGGEAYLL